MTDNQYLELFKVSQARLQRVLATAMGCGAGYADLYFEYTTYRSLTLRDGKVSSGGVHVDYGMGVRALDGDRTGYSYCESTEMADMLAAAKAAGSICGSWAAQTDGRTAGFSVAAGAGHGVGSGTCANLEVNAGQAPDFYPVATPWEDCSAKAQAAVLEKLQDMLLAADNRIVKVIARVSSSDTCIMMYNSLGQLVCDARPMGSLTATIIFTDGKITENRSTSLSYRSGAEMLCEENLRSMVGELVSGIDSMLEAGRPKGGKMPVVMGAGASGILLHEAMGHAFEADFNRKGQSVFSDKMGQQVCPRGINVVDDGTWTSNRGACNWDDEGVAGQKTYMVTDGVLTSYLHDRISARHYGVAPTGNGRRESFRYSPIPRMRLTYMESGSCSLQDMISSVKKGIFVDEFSNGQVKIGEGDFTFYVKCGRLIENGRLTAPIKDINIIGNGPRALADIQMVGNDLKIDNSTWTCGKDQSVPVGCGMPSVLVKSLTVGGE